MKKVKCVKEHNTTCPFCKAGIPRRVVSVIHDFKTGKDFIMDLSEETHNKIYRTNPKNSQEK